MQPQASVTTVSSHTIAHGVEMTPPNAPLPAVFLWWIATGLDGWQINGGGTESSLASLADPKSAGTGAFGGVLSTPWAMVWFNTLVTLICGCILGILSAKLAAALTPKPKAAAEAA